MASLIILHENIPARVSREHGIIIRNVEGSAIVIHDKSSDTMLHPGEHHLLEPDDNDPMVSVDVENGSSQVLISSME